MSTRSTIAMVTPRGDIDAIFCHWDGYPEYVGSILNARYTDERRVAKLMDMGDVDHLGKTLAKCRFYRRDFGDAEEDTRKETHKSLSEAVAAMTAELGWREYLYLFADKRWMVRAVEGDGFYRLQDALAVLKPLRDNRRSSCHCSEFDDIMQANGLRPRQFNAPSSLLA